MIHAQELEDAIAQMRGDPNPNANTCMKLAAYYVIQDHMFPDKAEPEEKAQTALPSAPAGYTYAAGRDEEVPAMGDTEFLQTITGRSMSAVLAVMDDCMTALKNTYPRLYHATIRRLQG